MVGQAARAPSRSRRARSPGSARRARCRLLPTASARARAARPRAAGRATPVRAGRARASGTAPRARRRARRSARASSSRSCRTCAASWNVLHSSRRASRRSRSSKRHSSSSSSMSSRPGSSRRAFSSTSVAAISRNSVVSSRSTVSKLLDLGAERVDDAREGDLPEVDLFLEDQVQQEVERALEDRRRDLVRHGEQATRRESQGCGISRNHQAGNGPASSRVCRACRACLFRDQADRRDAARQLPRRVRRWVDDQPAAGIGAGPRSRGDLLRRRPPRADRAVGSRRAAAPHPPRRDDAHGRRARRGPLAACSCRATCAPTPS